MNVKMGGKVWLPVRQGEREEGMEQNQSFPGTVQTMPPLGAPLVAGVALFQISLEDL
jgi:hypothetical protein